MEIENNKTEVNTDSISVLKAKKNYTINRLEGYSFKKWGFTIVAVLGGALGYTFFAIVNRHAKVSVNEYTPYIIIGVFTGALIYSYIIFMFRLGIQRDLKKYEFELARLGAEELKENIEENFFTKLVQINFKYIDQYYLQTQEQAEKSFKLASFASISGLAIIVIGIFMMYNKIATPAYVTTGAGVISQFIAAIFFYLYNQTILKMSQYHQKLVITQNISLALKMTDDMDKESKTKSLELIIDRLTFDVNKHLTDNKE